MKMDNQFVYVMDNKAYNGEYMKYGFTVNPHRRLRQAINYLAEPSNYVRLWRITEVPNKCLRVKQHDDVVKVIMMYPRLGYGIRSYYCGGGTEFFTGPPDEIGRVLTDHGYSIELVSLQNVQKTSHSDPEYDDAESSERNQLIRDIFGLENLTFNDDNNVSQRGCVVWNTRQYQVKAIEYATEKLLSSGRIYIELATGGGKSYIVYNLFKNLQARTIVILSPRQVVNAQNVKKQYTDIIGDICHVYNFSNNQEKFEDYLKKEGVKIIIACTQSQDKLWKHIVNNTLTNVCIWFDEAHWGIEDWLNASPSESKRHLLEDTHAIKYRIFTSASPDRELVKAHPKMFGEWYRPVKVSELISQHYLCPIQPFVYCEEKSNTDVVYFMLEHFAENNKTNGFSFHSDQTNASLVFYEHYNRYLTGETSIKPFLLCTECKLPNAQICEKALTHHMSLDEFEKTANSMGYVVSKYSMGYDFSKIDFICFADYKLSAKDIIQSIGRGTRPDKLGSNGCNKDKQLDVLLPVYDDSDGFEKFKRIAEVLAYLVDEVEIPFDKIIFTQSKQNNKKKKQFINANRVQVEYEGFEEIQSKVFDATKAVLNRGRRITYKYVKELNKKLNLQSKDEYFQNTICHRCFIREPETTFRQEWVSWYDFLGVDTTTFLATKSDFIAYCKGNNISTCDEYNAHYKASKKEVLPKDPFQMYPNFTNWAHELDNDDELVW